MNDAPKNTSQNVENLKNWFIGTYSVGAIGMVMGYAAAEQNKMESNYIILFSGIAAMIVYWLYAGNKGLTKNAASRMFGDSMYYMGFLFTLTSLAMALMRYLIGEEGVNAEAGMQQMFHIFGSAVITTVLGLLIRTYYTQFNKEDSDDMDKLRADFSQIINDLRENAEKLGAEVGKQIQECENSMKKITDVTNVAIAAEQKMVQAADKAAEEMANMRLGEKSQKLNQKIDEFNSHVGESTNAIMNLHKLGNNFARVMQEISTKGPSWEKLDENISKANQAVEQITQRAQVDSATLTGWKKTTEIIADQVKELERKTNQINNALEDCKNLFLGAPKDIKRYVRMKYMEMLVSLWRRAKHAEDRDKASGWRDGGARK